MDINSSYSFEYLKNEAEEKALVIYDSMWHSTEKMAHAIVSGLEDAGVSTNLINLDQD